jgi:hypothetical protein
VVTLCDETCLRKAHRYDGGVVAQGVVSEVVHVRTLCERYWYGRCELSLPLLMYMHLQYIQYLQH